MKLSLVKCNVFLSAQEDSIQQRREDEFVNHNVEYDTHQQHLLHKGGPDHVEGESGKS